MRFSDDRLRLVACIAVVVLLAGCGSVTITDEELESEQVETPTPEPTPDAGDDADETDEETAADADEADEEDASTPDGPEIYVTTVERLDGAEADAFEAAVTDEEGEFVESAPELFERLERAEEFGSTMTVSLAERVAADGEIDPAVLAAFDRVVATEGELVAAVRSEGFANSTDTYLIDAEAAVFGLDPRADASEIEAVAPVAEPLAEDGYSEREIAYIQRVGELAEHRGNQYEVWSQAAELGRLHDATADGEIRESDLEAIRNDADNRLLNGMEAEIGTDPELADTSGDGFDDHLKWGPLADLGVAVNPAEIDVYVEVDQARYAEQLERRQLSLIDGTMSRETGDDIPRVNIHFEECDTRASDVHTTEDLDQRWEEHHELRAYGFHYFFVNNGDVEFDGALVPGVARSSTHGPSWVMAHPDPDDSASEQASLVAHEFGHAFGIYDRDFDGVDSHEYSASRYHSVMNYNLDHTVTFSTGSPFDDYAEMQRNEFGQRYQSQQGLEEAWATGEPPEPDACGL